MFPNLSHSLPLNKYKIQNIDDIFKLFVHFTKKDHYTFYFYFFKIPKKHNSNDTFNKDEKGHAQG